MQSKHWSYDSKDTWRLAWGFLLAIAIHLALLPLVDFNFGATSSGTKNTRTIRLVPIETKNLPVRLPNSKMATAPRPAKAADQDKPDSKTEKLQDLKGQIVDVPPSPDSTPPDQAKYLSEFNTRTERETRSRHQAQVFENVMNEPTTTQAKKLTGPQNAAELKAALEIGPDNSVPEKTEGKSGSEATFEVPSTKRRDRLALKVEPGVGTLQNQDATPEIRGNSDRLKLSLGSADESSSKSTAPSRNLRLTDLVPSVGVLARISGAPANDHLEDLEEGEGTFLNSREFKYASFFNRLKRGVSQHWHPLLEYRRRDPSGNIYGFKSRVTVLNVVLEPNGHLKEVNITKSSGIDFLDNEAVSAFRRAEPFLNPPVGLINQGLIQFPFGFHIDFHSYGGLELPF